MNDSSAIARGHAMNDRNGEDRCPPSAVSHGVGIAGIVGLVLWTLLARSVALDGPYAGMAAVVACGLFMVAWSLLVDKVHRSPSTGFDWTRPPRPFRETLPVSLVKLLGLWATWGAIAAGYFVFRWYWNGSYLFAMEMFGLALPWLLGLSVPYVACLDRYMVDPHDGAFALGRWLTGRRPGAKERAEIAGYLRGWLIKGFFLAYMISIVPQNFADVVRRPDHGILASPVHLTTFLIDAMILVDVAFSTVGYIVTCRPLDAHIRSAEPRLAGWAAALACYPPFILMATGGPLDYQVHAMDWGHWLAGSGAAMSIVGAILALLMGVYAWATVAFGLRFSNLTHRGVLTHGPYRLTKHPAYLSKCLFWWLATLPFLVTSRSAADMVRNSAMLALVCGVYYWRARTEERHLMADPDYAAYAAWMDRHGPVTRLIAWILGRSVGRIGIAPRPG